MPPSAADRKSIRRLEKQAAIDASQRAAVVRNLMSTTEGRAWVWHHLSLSHVFASSFRPDPLTMAFTEGERNAGLRLLDEVMTTCPDQYIQAQREANVRDTLTEQRSRTVADGRDSGRTGADNAGSQTERHDDYDPFRDEDAGDETGAVYYENGRPAI